VRALAKAIRFAPPRQCQDGGGGGGDGQRAWLSKAYFVPRPGVKTQLRVALKSARVTKLSGRNSHHHAVLAVDGQRLRKHQRHAEQGSAEAQHGGADAYADAYADPPFIRLLLALDAHITDVVKTNTDTWFAHKMNVDLIDEYYRGCMTVLPGGKCGVRIAFDGGSSDDSALRALQDASGDPNVAVDVLLQFVGLRFHQQYFTCVWRLLEASDATAAAAASEAMPVPAVPPVPASAAPSPSAAPQTWRDVAPLFQHSEDMQISHDDDDDDQGLDPEVLATLVSELRDAVHLREQEARGRISAARELVRVLRLGGAAADDEEGLAERVLGVERDALSRLDALGELVRALEDASTRSGGSGGSGGSATAASVLELVEERLRHMR
jgi:hypothetical protein